MLKRVLAGAALVVAGSVVMAAWYCTAMPGVSRRGSLPALTAEETQLAQRLRAHVEAIAREPHNVPTPEALERVAIYIERTLADDGYTVTRQEFEAGGRRVRNLDVRIAGAQGELRGDIVVGAHYDSVPGAPGADDNGSGVAAVLELARELHQFKPPAGRTLRLALFVNEESPYWQTPEMGSWVYADAMRRQGVPVAAMLSLETLGYYSDQAGSQHYPSPLGLLYPDTGDFVGMVGGLHSRALVRRAIGSFRGHSSVPSEGASVPAFVEGTDWSDHASFARFGSPAIMITDTAPYRYPAYHSERDTPDQLDYARFARVVEGIGAVVKDLCNTP